MKRIVLCACAALFALFLVACGQTGSSNETGNNSNTSENNKVLIYSTSEDYRIEHMQEMLNAQFPNYAITIEYVSTGNLAAKLLAEGDQTDADIIGELDVGYLSNISDSLADLSAYDSSVFLDELVPANKKYLPMARFSGCIVVNTEVLAAKGLATPKSFTDLLKPEYKGLISMPNPKTSGTGYMFLKLLVNEWGEDEAFAYFEELTPNILAYTESGSGPVNALIQGEVGIGLAMTAQSVIQINQGAPLEIVFFVEGNPYAVCGAALIEGKQNNPAVKEVFDYYMNTVIPEDKQLYLPEKIYKDKDYTMPGYPTGIKYADMANNTPQEKERLLGKWAH